MCGRCADVCVGREDLREARLEEKAALTGAEVQAVVCLRAVGSQRRSLSRAGPTRAPVLSAPAPSLLAPGAWW